MPNVEILTAQGDFSSFINTHENIKNNYSQASQALTEIDSTTTEPTTPTKFTVSSSIENDGVRRTSSETTATPTTPNIFPKRGESAGVATPMTPTTPRARQYLPHECIADGMTEMENIKQGNIQNRKELILYILGALRLFNLQDAETLISESSIDVVRHIVSIIIYFDTVEPFDMPVEKTLRALGMILKAIKADSLLSSIEKQEDLIVNHQLNIANYSAEWLIFDIVLLLLTKNPNAFDFDNSGLLRQSVDRSLEEISKFRHYDFSDFSINSQAFKDTKVLYKALGNPGLTNFSTPFGFVDKRTGSDRTTLQRYVDQSSASPVQKETDQKKTKRSGRQLFASSKNSMSPLSPATPLNQAHTLARIDEEVRSSSAKAALFSRPSSSPSINEVTLSTSSQPIARTTLEDFITSESLSDYQKQAIKSLITALQEEPNDNLKNATIRLLNTYERKVEDTHGKAPFINMTPEVQVYEKEILGFSIGKKVAIAACCVVGALLGGALGLTVGLLISAAIMGFDGGLSGAWGAITGASLGFKAALIGTAAVCGGLSTFGTHAFMNDFMKSKPQKAAQKLIDSLSAPPPAAKPKEVLVTI